MLRWVRGRRTGCDARRYPLAEVPSAQERTCDQRITNRTLSHESSSRTQLRISSKAPDGTVTAGSDRHDVPPKVHARAAPAAIPKVPIVSALRSRQCRLLPRLILLRRRAERLDTSSVRPRQGGESSHLPKRSARSAHPHAVPDLRLGDALSRRRTLPYTVGWSWLAAAGTKSLRHFRANPSEGSGTPES